MPFPPQMAYMAQPVWPVLGETPMPIGMNSPYMMNPVNPMNPPQAIPSNLMEPSHIETQPQENVNMNVTNQPMNGNSINMNQNLNNSNEMNEPNFKSVSPSKNMNHQGINFSGILVNNAEQSKFYIYVYIYIFNKFLFKKYIYIYFNNNDITIIIII